MIDGVVPAHPTAARAAFYVLLGLHVGAAVVGFTSVAVSGWYGARGGRPGDAGEREEIRRYFSVPGRLQLLVAAVPFLGAAALAVEPGGRGLAQLWAGLAVIVWAVAVTSLFGVVRPAERRLRAALASGATPPLGRDSGRVRLGAALCDVCFAVAFSLMVVQPR